MPKYRVIRSGYLETEAFHNIWVPTERDLQEWMAETEHAVSVNF